ncbi:MAG: hypothetical protein ACP5SJ_01940 [Candidatus Micrarchaeia archaeon]
MQSQKDLLRDEKSGFLPFYVEALNEIKERLQDPEGFPLSRTYDMLQYVAHEITCKSPELLDKKVTYEGDTEIKTIRDVLESIPSKVDTSASAEDPVIADLVGALISALEE